MADEVQLPQTARELTAPGLIAVTWCGFGLAAFLVSLRCYARVVETKKLHSDDYWLLAALTFLLANAILQTLQTPSVFFLTWLEAGRPAPPEEIVEVGNIYVRYEFVIIGFFWTITWCVKASFLAMYRRLFNGQPQYLRLWWVTVVFAVLAYVGCWIASAWTCHPPSSYFNFGKCMKPIDVRGGIISISYSTAVDILTDLMIMLLPIRILPSLQISRAQKQGLALIFGIGCFIIATAIVRLTQIVRTQRSDSVGLAVWGLVESNVAVVVGSLPALKGLVTRKLKGSFSSSFRSSRSRRMQKYGNDEEWHGLSKNENRVVVDAATSDSSEGFDLSERHVRQPSSTNEQIMVEREYIVH